MAQNLFAWDIAIELGKWSAVDGGKYYVCTCPAHDDQGSALCIGDNRGGGGVWAKCTSGCTDGAVQRALQSRRLWPSGGHRKTVSSLEAAKQRRRDREWQQYNAKIVEILSPVPKNAPPIDWTRLSNEPLSSIHDYKDENGRLLFSVAQRVELLGGKLYCPAVFVKRRDGQLEWAFEYPNEPRALYGLDLLARMPDADVLIVESEETADAARVLLPQNVVLTWFGGSRAIDSADWTPLQRRTRIILWPDNDAQGTKAMQQVEAILMGLGVKTCTVSVPSDFPHTWNLADPIPEGHDVLEIIKRTKA